jgi:putative transposase
MRFGRSSKAAGHRALSQAGDQRADLLHLEERFARMSVAELKRVRQLEEENQRLKSVVADLTLDKHMLQGALRKKF